MPSAPPLAPPDGLIVQCTVHAAQRRRLPSASLCPSRMPVPMPGLCPVSDLSFSPLPLLQRLRGHQQRETVPSPPCLACPQPQPTIPFPRFRRGALCPSVRLSVRLLSVRLDKDNQQMGTQASVGRMIDEPRGRMRDECRTVESCRQTRCRSCRPIAAHPCCSSSLSRSRLPERKRTSFGGRTKF